MKALANTKDMNIFDASFIQRFIDFQWESSLSFGLYLQLISHMFCCILIILNIEFLDAHRGEIRAKLRFWFSLVLFITIITTVFTNEAKQLCNDGLNYFKSGWNINDCCFLITFMLAVFYDMGTFYTNDEAYDTDTTETVRIYYSLLVIFSFIKLLDNLRIFNNISFIVKMLMRVISDLIPFLGLFIGFIILFSLVVSALEIELENVENDPYSGLPEWIGMTMFIFRTSLGDFDVDPFTNLTTATRIFIWLFWLIIVFANTIIFLNFLIAVISDVYEQVMENRTEEIF